MADLDASEKLDQLIDALIAGVDEPKPRLKDSLSALLSIAGDLRGLPREEFKLALGSDLKGVAMNMATSQVAEVREGFHTITPYIAVKQAPELMQFVKEAFGAEGTIHGTGSEGGLHAEFLIGDSMVMIGGGEAWRGAPTPTALHLYVNDVDEVYQRSLQAGATSMHEPMEDHGERLAGVKDLAGNEWYIAKRLSGSHTAEGLRTVNVYLHPQGAALMIEFLKRAFGAEEVAVYYAGPKGPVVHAKIRIGDSVLEMGEAHGIYQPMPTMFYLYVNDVDEWYKRAVAGGATSKDEPADQYYGDRTAAVTDDFGNIWYMGKPIKNP
jgi:PhnB protein